MLLSGNLALLQDFKLFLIDSSTLDVFIPSETVCFSALCPAMLCVDASTSARRQRNESKCTETRAGQPEGKRERNDSSRNEMCGLQIFDDAHPHHTYCRCQGSATLTAVSGYPY